MKCWKKACSFGKNSFSLTPSRKENTPLKQADEISCICCTVCFLANRTFTTKCNYVDLGEIDDVRFGSWPCKNTFSRESVRSQDRFGLRPRLQLLAAWSRRCSSPVSGYRRGPREPSRRLLLEAFW